MGCETEGIAGGVAAAGGSLNASGGFRCATELSAASVCVAAAAPEVGKLARAKISSGVLRERRASQQQQTLASAPLMAPHCVQVLITVTFCAADGSRGEAAGQPDFSAAGSERARKRHRMRLRNLQSGAAKGNAILDQPKGHDRLRAGMARRRRETLPKNFGNGTTRWQNGGFCDGRLLFARTRRPICGGDLKFNCRRGREKSLGRKNKPYPFIARAASTARTRFIGGRPVEPAPVCRRTPSKPRTRLLRRLQSRGRDPSIARAPSRARIVYCAGCK